jgi:hypothetical protein
VFDPERDEDPGARPFCRRLLVVVLIGATGCLALWPSVSAFSAGPDHARGCLAIADGWRAQKAAPDVASIESLALIPPSAAQQQDPVAMARWRAEWRAFQARPEVQQANAYLDWQQGAGACIPESRHRLIESGVGLFMLAGIVVATGLARRRRALIRTRRMPRSEGLGIRA